MKLVKIDNRIYIDPERVFALSEAEHENKTKIYMKDNGIILFANKRIELVAELINNYG